MIDWRKMLGLKRSGPLGMGWKPNTPDERDVSWSPLAGMRPAKLPYLNLEPFVPKLLNQGPTSSCVGQAAESAIAIREAVLGLPYNPPSARGIYTLARATHDSEHIDGGTYPRAAWKAIAKHGCPLKADWPWSVAGINDVPPSMTLLRGFRCAGFGYEHIFEVGDAKLERIKLAIGQGLPVFFGTTVRSGFMNHRGPGVYYSLGSVEGGHAMVIVGWRPMDGAFRILNSWGRSWGDGGFAWVDPQWVKDSFRDLTVCHSWKNEKAGREGYPR